MARKRQKQSRTTEPISRTERKLLAAYRSMTMAATHLDNSLQSLRAAHNSEDFMIHVAAFQSLFGVRACQCALLSLMVMRRLKRSLPDMMAIPEKKLTRRLKELADLSAVQSFGNILPEGDVRRAHTGYISRGRLNLVAPQKWHQWSLGKNSSRDPPNISNTTDQTTP